MFLPHKSDSCFSRSLSLNPLGHNSVAIVSSLFLRGESGPGNEKNKKEHAPPRFLGQLGSRES